MEHGAGLVEELRQTPERGQDGHGVGVVVDHDPGVGTPAVELGVDMDGRRHVPPAGHHAAVHVDAQMSEADISPHHRPQGLTSSVSYRGVAR